MKKYRGKVLWVDDEIDHLKSHILFLEQRGYSVQTVTNAEDAISLLKEKEFDIVLLDEMLTGMNGLEALSSFHQINPSLPIIMITKSEEENLMEDAIGEKIEDYLTKPVNPSQILSSCKRILERKRIECDKITRDYVEEFEQISDSLSSELKASEWIDIYYRLSSRWIDLDNHSDIGLQQTFSDQQRECNHHFCRFIEKNYEEWLQSDERPVLSVDLLKKYLFPLLKRGERVLFLVIDNMRMDQWLSIEPLIYDLFTVNKKYYFSILPTATPYSRNSLFSGLFPRDIARLYPKYWKEGENDESSRNRYEPQLLIDYMKREGVDIVSKTKYIKLLNAEEANRIENQIESYFSLQLISMIFNFIDIMAHRRSESQILQEILPDESAYRSLTRTWFKHSSLFKILRKASERGIKTIITSDHGSIRVLRGVRVYGDRETSKNLRYKWGNGIKSDSKYVLDIKNPSRFGLPSPSMSTNYLIAKEDSYFVYPTNYHHYLSLYNGSLQHGGISMEEMILPIIFLTPREGVR